MDTNYLFSILNSIKPMSEGFRTYLTENLIHYHFCSGDHMPYRPPVSRTIYFISYGIVGGITAIGLFPEAMVLYCCQQVIRF